jgi:opacity protein-like surface antigen
MPKTLSPYFVGGVGWGWFDSNIATGDVSGVCWWDPWYGYICNAYPETYGSDAFVYRAGAGLRFDATPGFTMKVLYNAQWNDFGNTESVPFQSQIRLEFGSMFR